MANGPEVRISGGTGKEKIGPIQFPEPKTAFRMRAEVGPRRGGGGGVGGGGGGLSPKNRWLNESGMNPDNTPNLKVWTAEFPPGPDNLAVGEHGDRKRMGPINTVVKSGLRDQFPAFGPASVGVLSGRNKSRGSRNRLPGYVNHGN